MNLPNKLTLLRVLFVPVIMVFLLMEGIPYRWLIGGLCFGAASLTDMLDGKIARKRNLITDFGKLMDPVADKMLIMSTLICFVQEEICGAWVVVESIAFGINTGVIQRDKYSGHGSEQPHGGGKQPHVFRFVVIFIQTVIILWRDPAHAPENSSSGCLNWLPLTVASVNLAATSGFSSSVCA